MCNVAGECLAALQAILGASPRPSLESLQVAAARLGLFVLRTVQLLPSGVSWTQWLETSGAVWICLGTYTSNKYSCSIFT